MNGGVGRDERWLAGLAERVARRAHEARRLSNPHLRQCELPCRHRLARLHAEAKLERLPFFAAVMDACPVEQRRPEVHGHIRALNGHLGFRKRRLELLHEAAAVARKIAKRRGFETLSWACPA